MSAVDIQHVSHAFGRTPVLRDVTLSVASGSFTVFLGPSGSGKTTLLNLIGGFLPLQNGTLSVAGRNMQGVPPAHRATATVFQDYALFPHMSVAENVGFGLKMAGVPGAERRARVAEMLALVGLPHAANARPHRLSGGQRQRVALARALAVEPSVLLLDEPLGALDLKLRLQMQEELTRIQRAVGATFIHVTHDQDEAIAIADTIVVMNEGQIADLGPPREVYLRPRSLFSATFLGKSDILRGRVREVSGEEAVVDTPLGPVRGVDRLGSLSVGVQAVVLLRPEQITLDAGEPLCDAVVRSVTFAGPHLSVTVDALGQELSLLAPHGAPVAPGLAVALCYRPSDAVVLEDG